MSNDSVDLGVPGIVGAVEVGRGGFATVYRARQPALERDVAVKVVHAGVLSPADDKFVREVRAAGRLSQHPNVVPVYDVGTTASGQAYLMMPYYERGSLQGLIERNGALAEPIAVRLGRTLASTLDYVHKQGVVHRDVKPANILLAEGDEPMLGDFGVAKVSNASVGLQTVGANVVTWAYGPPEAFTGGQPSPAWDIYSLGATVYAMLAGSPPFVDDDDASIFTVLNRIGNVEVPDLSVRGVSAPVAAAVRQAMAKAPEDRPSSAAEFGAMLVSRMPPPALPPSAAAAAAEPRLPEPPHVPEGARPWPVPPEPVPDKAPPAPATAPPPARERAKGARLVVLLSVVALAAHLAGLLVNVYASEDYDSVNSFSDEFWGSTPGLAKAIVLWAPSSALVAGLVLLAIHSVPRGVAFEWFVGAAAAMFVFDAWYDTTRFFVAGLDVVSPALLILRTGVLGLATVLIVVLSWGRARQPGPVLLANQRWLLLAGCALVALSTLLMLSEFENGGLWLVVMAGFIALVLVRAMALPALTTGAAALVAAGSVGALCWMARVIGDGERLLGESAGVQLQAFLAVLGFACIAAVGVWRWSREPTQPSNVSPP